MRLGVADTHNFEAMVAEPNPLAGSVVVDV